MERVKFSKKQIEALHRMLKQCRDCAYIRCEFNDSIFAGAVESAFHSLFEDKYLFLDSDKLFYRFPGNPSVNVEPTVLDEVKDE